MKIKNQNIFYSASLLKENIAIQFIIKVTAYVFLLAILAPISNVCFALEASPPVGSTFRDCPECPKMVVLPKGQFLMGTSDDQIKRDIQEVPDEFKHGIPFLTPGQLDYMAEEQPQHLVTIDYSLAMSATPITVGEFKTFTLQSGYRTGNGCTLANKHYRPSGSANWTNPGFEQSDQDPVVCVNLRDVQVYLSWLNDKITNKTHNGNIAINYTSPYHIPSESEWEYAARAGSDTTRWWGNLIGANNAVCTKCGSVFDNKRTAPVGSFKANLFGLYDMLGNVFQWTADCWNEKYVGAPVDGRAWAVGSCSERTIRGGSWFSDSWIIRSSSRMRGDINQRLNDHGFRVAKEMQGNHLTQGDIQ